MYYDGADVITALQLISRRRMRKHRMLIVQNLIIYYIINSPIYGRAEEDLAIFHIFTGIRFCSGRNLCSQLARTFSSRCNLPNTPVECLSAFSTRDNIC